MKCRKTIYCEYQFVKSLPQDQLDDFYRFSNESVIVFDISMNQFLTESMENTIFKYIRKRQQAGGCELIFEYDKDKFDNDCKNAKMNSYNPVILIYQSNRQRKFDNRCSQLFRDYGFLSADQNDFLDKCNLIKDYGFAIKKSTIGSWKKLLENIPVYGNSLIIVDNYLLDRDSTFDLNLEPILNALLPESLDVVYNISFFTQDSNSTLKFNTVKIKELIRNIRPNLNFTVNFFVDVKHLFHDRVIISNYFWMQCGAGFDLFGNKSKAIHSTSVTFIYPFIQNYVPWAKDAFCYLLEDVKETANSAINNGPVIQYYGESKKNRLFEMQ